MEEIKKVKYTQEDLIIDIIYCCNLEENSIINYNEFFDLCEKLRLYDNLNGEKNMIINAAHALLGVKVSGINNIEDSRKLLNEREFLLGITREDRIMR